ncbi:MAG: exopolyphosphatase [Selenomonas ruminantium]|jgi:exopolyphosphatase/guanosine-5'-triphosphate,3'-diphosphate pyrophosphatase|uniref:Exopolyphosphatase n=1 Tax=Selenomonas ruminantium TaxID=971 RepID=A0A927ZR31_SELRU|nr:rod shape-determining protein [Selenomonas ruminantium]MBE6085799.1 exopolyphosphatase [Selenomonas ruminantium]
MLHGIIDIGSNTIRMAVYLIEGGHFEQLMKRKETVGLASYVEDGIMQQEGIDRAVETLQEYKKLLQCFNITQVDAFTTAALRNAQNSRQAVGEIESRTGIKIRVISGDEEATLDFIGATHSLNNASGLLIDIGGGSTEIVTYRNRQIQYKTSLPIGSLSFAKKYVSYVLPTMNECLEMYGEAEATVGAAADFINICEAEIVGIGGTFKGACALNNELFNLPAANRRLETKNIRPIIGNFIGDLGMTQEMAVALMRSVPERIQTIIPGLVIANVLARRFQSHWITYSDSGVREGYIYSHIIDK